MAPDDEPRTPDCSSADEREVTPHPPRERRTLSLPALASAEALDYQPESGVYRAEFDLRLDAPSQVVVQAVAVVADESPLALDSLYSALDPDALDALVASQVRDAHTGDARVTFAYSGYEVALESDGVVEITPDGNPSGDHP